MSLKMNLGAAANAAGMTTRDLLAAHKDADPVLSILLLQMIEQSRVLDTAITNLVEAKRSAS